jgi:nitroreductase
VTNDPTNDPTHDPANDAKLFDIMSTCRSMRRLSSEPVPEPVLHRLVEAAGYAPSGRNLQRARWILVRGAGQKAAIAELNRRASEAPVRDHIEATEELPHHDRAKRRRMWEAVLWQTDHLHEAPALIVACCILDHADQDPYRYGSSVWPGIQNLLLAARAHGLGAVPTTFALQFRAELSEVLELPPRVCVQAIIPVGYPTGNFGPVRRLAVSDVLMDERWQGTVPVT